MIDKLKDWYHSQKFWANFTRIGFGIIIIGLIFTHKNILAAGGIIFLIGLFGLVNNVTSMVLKMRRLERAQEEYEK